MAHGPSTPHAVFVYGTLKRGECRAKHWPHPPVEVRPAAIRAALYDLGPYPAIVAGEDMVAGELWILAPQHVADTLHVLDRVEGFGQGGRDLYVRCEVECCDDRGQTHRAFTYFYARGETLAKARRLTPDASGRCRWEGSRQG